MRQHYKDFLIRDWQPGDRQIAADLIGTVLAEYGLGWDPAETDRDVLEVEECYHAVGGEFWIVEQQGDVVGTAGYYPVPHGENGVELRKMYLSPTVRGQGLGTYLLKSAETVIAQKGFGQVWIETASVLKEAVCLYEKNGYLPPEEGSKPDASRCDRVYVKQISAT